MLDDFLVGPQSDEYADSGLTTLWSYNWEGQCNLQRCKDQDDIQVDKYSKAKRLRDLGFFTAARHVEEGDERMAAILEEVAKYNKGNIGEQVLRISVRREYEKYRLLG